MKTIRILPLCAVALLATACNDSYMDQFETPGAIADVKNVVLTLQPDDYGAIASNAANRALAAALDAEAIAADTLHLGLDSTANAKALAAVKGDRYFTDLASADTYVPALLASRYPEADNGSKFIVTYNQYAAPADFLSRFGYIAAYTLEDEDYEEVRSGYSYLVYDDLGALATYLDDIFDDGSEGDMMVVNYRYETADGDAATLFGHDGMGWKPYAPASLTVAALPLSVCIDAAPLWLARRYPFAKADDVVALVTQADGNVSVSEYYCDGTVWAARPAYEEAVMTFMKDNGTIAANLSVFLDETFLGNPGNFTVQNVTLAEGLTYAWANTAIYGWKASAYYNSTNNDADAWLVSPALNFKKAQQPVLTYDSTHKYLNGHAPTEYFDVLVSTDYTDDVTTATWTSIIDRVEHWATGDDWTFVNAGTLSLADFVGSPAVTIAFRYLSNADASPTWEVKNLKVVEASYLKE